MAPPPPSLKVCVFSGSRPGINPAFASSAVSLARAIHAKSWGLVYGGGTKGLMGACAKTLHQLGGDVHGIRVRALIQREGEDCGRSTECETMHERKARMAMESDAFVALPGGFGTLDELVEIITWSQIGMHDKPIVVFNVDGFFDAFLGMVDGFVQQGFVEEGMRNIVRQARTVEEVVAAIEQYAPPDGRLKLEWGPSSELMTVETRSKKH